MNNVNDRTRSGTSNGNATGVTTSEMTRVFDTMGTTVSVVVGDRCAPELVAEAVGQVTEVFTSADARYSRYRPESEISRICRGELQLADASAQLRQMYELAISWRNQTNGAFTPHPGDGSIDLSGVVKAWAIAKARTVLTSHGLYSWCLNAGGDVLTSGLNNAMPWSVGIIDPTDRTTLLASVRMSETLPALATSGSAERGEHIWAQTKDSRGQFTQVSVLAPDIVTADALATAIIAGGKDTMNLATSTWPIQLLAVRKNGELLSTPGLATLLAA